MSGLRALGQLTTSWCRQESRALAKLSPISFMYMRKRLGPKALAWGARAFTEYSWEIDPLGTTNSERSKREFLITFNRNPQTPYAWSFFSMPRYHTVKSLGNVE